MTSHNKPVTSREYKLILNNHCFSDRADGARALWEIIAHHVATKLNGVIIKTQKKEDIRHTRYLDTPDHAMRRKGLILRVRREGKHGNSWKTTLKYRASDRYISAGQDIRIAGCLQH